MEEDENEEKGVIVEDIEMQERKEEREKVKKMKNEREFEVRIVCERKKEDE